MAIFFKPEGVTGSSVIEGHAGEIEVLSFSFGVSIPVSVNPSNKQRVQGLPDFQDVTITKRTDVATPPLMVKCASGTAIKTGKIAFQREVDGKKLDYIVIDLTDIYVSSISIGGSDYDVPVETVTLSFSKIEVVYTEQAVPGEKTGNAPFGWDLSTGKAA